MCVLPEGPAGSGAGGWPWEPLASREGPRRVQSLRGKRGAVQSTVVREEGQEGREGVHGVDPSAAGAAFGLVLLLFWLVYWDVTSSGICLPRAHDGVTVTLNVQKTPSCPLQSVPSLPPDPRLTPAAPSQTPTGPPEAPQAPLGPATPHRPMQTPSSPRSPHLIFVAGAQGCLFRNVRMGPSVCVSLPTPRCV